jgi:hypothetical protein
MLIFMLKIPHPWYITNFLITKNDFKLRIGICAFVYLMHNNIHFIAYIE